MDYKQCTHYEELLILVAENKDFEDISFEITDVEKCNLCIESKSGICSLWNSITFISQIRPQMGIEEAKLTIENIDNEMGKIATGLLNNFRSSAKK